MSDGVCTACRAGFHDECLLWFAGMLGPEQDCCCEGAFSIDDVAFLQDAAAAAGSAPTAAAAVVAPKDPGYVHPDAWKFAKSIGDFTDPGSTGRKLAAKLYPITPGMVCEWARLQNCGGGAHPIIGCLGNPASDIHHGPDKNTLDNEKKSWGVGERENIHLICSPCHNRWHAANDATYPAYDRVADQASPWVPEGAYGEHDPRAVAFDELVAEEKRRRELGEAKGGRAGGRGAAGLGQAAPVDPLEED